MAPQPAPGVPDPPRDGPFARGGFATTQWSLVVAAGGTRSDSQVRIAMQDLCQAYWAPLYAYARRRGVRAAEAEDLTQGFFVELIERDVLVKADRERGRFRHFLLGAFRNHLARDRERASAQKRGGDLQVFSFDFADGERRYALEPQDDLTPERVFERRWALTVLERAMDDVRAHYAARGQEELIAELAAFLHPEGRRADRGEVAARLGLKEGALRVALHRARQRYGDALRQQIRATVEDDAAVEAEIADLLSALAG